MTNKMKTKIISMIMSVLLIVSNSPMYVYAGNPYPECHHGDIGTNVSTMYPIYGRVQHVYNEFGQFVERVWYRCSLCGYETYVEFPL